MDEINRILEGRHSPIGCVDEDVKEIMRNHEKTVKDIKDKTSKDGILDAKNGRCLLCRCPHNPERARLLAGIDHKLSQILCR